MESDLYSNNLRGRIARAQDLSDDARYGPSNALLMDVLSLIDNQSAENADYFRGKVFGLLGLNFFRLSDMAQAQHFTELALQVCRQDGDDEGIRIYSANLNFISSKWPRAGED